MTRRINQSIVGLLGCAWLGGCAQPSSADPAAPRSAKHTTTANAKAIDATIGQQVSASPVPSPISGPFEIVRQVTTLADYGQGETPVIGSLRWWLTRPPLGAALLVKITFKVGGTIMLRDKLTIRTPRLTIDGSTAPGAGITLAGHQVEIVDTSFVTLRCLRIRAGDGYADDAARREMHGEYDKLPGQGGSGGWRSLVVFGSPRPAGAPAATADITVEHCSIQNSTDDNVNVWGDCRRVLFCDCLFSGGLGVKRGLLAGAPAGQAAPNYPDWLTLSGCVFADLDIRVPDVAGGVCTIANCVIAAPHQGARLTGPVNLLRNSLWKKPNHPWGKNADRVLVADPAKIADLTIYSEVNWIDGIPRGDSNVVGVTNGADTDIPWTKYRPERWPLWPANLALVCGDEVVARTLREAGCTQPKRDAEDERVIGLVRKLTTRG